MLYRSSLALVLLVALALVTGCGPKVERVADPRGGDFYTEEEFQRLSKDQREAYCAKLLDAYQDGEGCVDAGRSNLTKEAKAVADLEGELTGMNPRLMSLRSEVESLENEIAYFEGLPRVYTVAKGDFLYKISGFEEIYADPLKWKRIWRANKDVIAGFADPNLIYPDWELAIPREWPHSYTVQGGESLWRIASYWEVYDDGRMWGRIYEANKDAIGNPDVIQPGQILTIPR